MPRRLFQCMIFDVGDILYDATYWRRWLTNAITQTGKLISYEQLVADWEALLTPVYTGHTSYWSQFEQLLCHYCLTQPQILHITSEAKVQSQLAKSHRKPFPFVQETLAALSTHGTTLIALSDSESGEQVIRETLRQLQIETYFAAVLSSRDIGFAKPNPKTYEAAVKAASKSQEHCVFIGHDIDELDGAARFGLPTIAFNQPPEARATYYISRFDELTTYA